MRARVRPTAPSRVGDGGYATFVRSHRQETPMTTRDPAADADHICAELGELQPACDGYYCQLEREALARAEAEAPCETHGIKRCTICTNPPWVRTGAE